jgi:hypothetical protein
LPYDDSKCEIACGLEQGMKEDYDGGFGVGKEMRVLWVFVLS